MFSKLFFYFVLSVLFIQKPALGQNGHKRKVALTIGISQYEFLDSLHNPVFDAKDMAAALSKIGYDAKTLINPTKTQLDQFIDEFAKELGDSSTVVLYFSGHGMSCEGENYLLPRDAVIKRSKDIRSEACSVTSILNRINKHAKLLANIILLDACFPAILSGKTSHGKTRHEDPDITYPVEQTFIGYASMLGSPALGSNDRRNSLFTEAMLKYMHVPNVPVDQLFSLVNKEVRTNTSNRQIPCMISTMDKDFFLCRSAP